MSVFLQVKISLLLLCCMMKELLHFQENVAVLSP